MSKAPGTGAAGGAPEAAADAAVVVAMLEALEPLALAELERALRLKLFPTQTAAERRASELGFLARLLEERAAEGQSPRFLPRQLYEARQPVEAPEAPEAKWLVAKYGWWQQVCRAASSMRPDGRIQGDTAPYTNQMRGRRRVAKYTHEEVRYAIRRCALELGRIPSSGVYQRWAFDVKRDSRQAGLELPRIPDLKVVYHWYKTWTAAAVDAGVTAAEVARARIERVLGLAGIEALPTAPLERFKEADTKALAKIGIDPARRKFLCNNGLALLTLQEAIAIARLLEGSLDWLAGIAPQPGEPPDHERVFDTARLDTLLENGPLTTAQLRQRLELDLSAWRQLRGGKREPLLYELLVVAVAAKCSITDLLREG